jgi:hypothetical protein
MPRGSMWLSVQGVWLQTAALAAWLAVSWLVGLFSPGLATILFLVGAFPAFFVSHTLAISSLIGCGLLITRRASCPASTLLSAIVGGAISIFFLRSLYF